MRVTLNYLKKWLQSEFERFEIDLVVKDAHRTRYRGQDYEAGAATLVFKVGYLNSDMDTNVFCFCWLSEIQTALMNGKKLKWVLKDSHTVIDSYITYE